MRGSLDTIRVAALSTTAVKGLRMTSRERIVLAAAGVPEDRRFYLIDSRGRMVNGKHLADLTAVEADYDHDHRRLTLTFPSGLAVSGAVRSGPPVETRLYSRSARASLVDGPWSQALSRHCGRDLRLVESEPLGSAVDRGRAGGVTLIGRASIARLAEVAPASLIAADHHLRGETPGDTAPATDAVPAIDARRFRMLIEISGVGANVEDRWVGERVRVGGAVVAFRGHVGRCVVTSRNPDTGRPDLPTLELLGRYRREAPTTEPLALGIHGEVVDPGPVAVGDPIMVL